MLTPAAVLELVRSWPVADRVEFYHQLEDHFAEEGVDPAVPAMTPELAAELDRRLAAYEADPTDVVPRYQFKVKLRASDS